MKRLHSSVRKTSKVLRLHGTIARDLGIAIVSGRYKPGDLLSGEIASSEILEVSRTAYREAIRILAAKGLVVSKPKIGTKVNARNNWHILDPDVLEWAFETEPDFDMLNSLFELRDVVESAAAGYAALRRSEAQLKAMRQALAGMERYTLGTEAGRLADTDFHATLMQATGNPFIISLIEGFSAAIVTTNLYKQREHPLRRDPIPDHLHVFEAIADKDPTRAQAAMRELIQLARLDTPMSPPVKKRQSQRGK
jgi:DNA-binding FadR family transcriptional regulator